MREKAGERRVSKVYTLTILLVIPMNDERDDGLVSISSYSTVENLSTRHTVSVIVTPTLLSHRQSVPRVCLGNDGAPIDVVKIRSITKALDEVDPVRDAHRKGMYKVHEPATGWMNNAGRARTWRVSPNQRHLQLF